MLTRLAPDQVSGTASSSKGRQILGGSLSRPAKPTSASRRRPAHLVLAGVPDTPGLTSPSASESSSRLSLDTKLSENASVGSSRTRPRGAGHHRQKSSAVVNLEATIKEEPSLATLRLSKGSPDAVVRLPIHHSSRTTLRGPQVEIWGESEDVDLDGDDADTHTHTDAVTSWLRFQREADAVCRRTRSFYRDSVESKLAVSKFKVPLTNDEVTEFLARSTAAYQPLEQRLPTGRTAHRRKSSLSDSRAMISPYGLPLPKPTQPNKPKGSLTTKFERSNSSGGSTAPSAVSSTFSFIHHAQTQSHNQPQTRVYDSAPAPGSAGQPSSSIFSKWAREVPPTPPATAETFGSLSPIPFSLPAFDAFGLQHAQKRLEDEAKARASADAGVVSGPGSGSGSGSGRCRVTSQARRQALGWGRRRNSDGPAKVVDSMAKVPPVPKTAMAASFGLEKQSQTQSQNRQYKSHLTAPVAVPGNKENHAVQDRM